MSDSPRSSAKTTFFFLLIGLDGSFSSDDEPDDDDDDPILPSESVLMTRHGLLGLSVCDEPCCPDCGILLSADLVGDMVVELRELVLTYRRTGTGDGFCVTANRKFL